MNPFSKKLIERFIGKQFRTISDVIVENYETTADRLITESVFDELFEDIAFETYIEFLSEQISLPVLASTAPQPEAKKYSFATMKADMADTHKLWRDKKAKKAARADLGIRPGTKLFTAQGGNPKLAKEESTIPDRGTIGLTLLPEKQ